MSNCVGTGRGEGETHPILNSSYSATVYVSGWRDGRVVLGTCVVYDRIWSEGLQAYLYRMNTQ